MTYADDLALVVELACRTSHRDPAEQRALLRMAVIVEKERNSLVVTNRRDPAEPASRLVARVLYGNPLDVPLAPKVAAAVERRRAGWKSRRAGGPEAAWPTNPS